MRHIYLPGQAHTVPLLTFTPCLPLVVQRVSLELGGNAPLIVFEDADLEQAAMATVSLCLEQQGHSTTPSCNPPPPKQLAYIELYCRVGQCMAVKADCSCSHKLSHVAPVRPCACTFPHAQVLLYLIPVPCMHAIQVASALRNSGQTCICTNRVFVHVSVHDKFAGAYGWKSHGVEVTWD